MIPSFLCRNITYRDLLIFTIFMYLNLFWGFMISYVYLLIFFLNNANLIICSFIFWGFLSFKPIGVPHFWRAIDLFAIMLMDCLVRTSIQAGAFIAGIWYSVTPFESVNAFGSWFVMSYKWSIFWTSCSHCFVQGSKFNNDNAFHVISLSNCLISPSNVGIIVSSKWQLTNRVVNKSPVKGSKYLIIDGDSNPIYIISLL